VPAEVRLVDLDRAVERLGHRPLLVAGDQPPELGEEQGGRVPVDADQIGRRPGGRAGHEQLDQLAPLAGGEPTVPDPHSGTLDAVNI
jgi:hypothetical protein